MVYKNSGKQSDEESRETSRPADSETLATLKARAAAFAHNARAPATVAAYEVRSR